MILEGKTKSKTWRVVLLVLVLAVSFLQPVWAQNEQSGSGLSISPTKLELKIDAGTKSSANITLKNVSNVDIIAKADINDFESDNVSGEPRILTSSTQQTATSIKPFIDSLGDVQMKKDESKELELEFNVPKGTAPGAYWGIIRYSAIPITPTSPDPGQVSLTASVGLVTLIEVPGDIIEQIQLNKIQVFDLIYQIDPATKQKIITGSRQGRFFTGAPEQLGVEIKNNGNGFSRPFGRVSITNMSGAEVFSYELNKPESDSVSRASILPKSTRVFRDNISNVSTPGRYKVTANISHGGGGEVLTLTTTFWVVPWWLILVIATVIGVLILFLIWLYHHKFSRHRRHH